jgi:alkylation response protein AidB-like acyl-CoA dehydrogenase
MSVASWSIGSECQGVSTAASIGNLGQLEIAFTFLRPQEAGPTKAVSVAMLMTQRAIVEIADQFLQIHGRYAYTREYGIEHVGGNVRLGPIIGGTDGITKEFVGKTMGM